jgi:hypothetical protein
VGGGVVEQDPATHGCRCAGTISTTARNGAPTARIAA